MIVSINSYRQANASNFITKTFVVTEALGPVDTTPEAEFENGGFTLKTHQMFSVYTTLEEFENVTISGHSGFEFEESSVRENA